MKNRLRRFGLPFAGLLLVFGLTQLPRLIPMTGNPAIGGPFTLTDQAGKTVTPEDFRGRWMLVYFGYTYCPDVCPTTLADVVQAYNRLTPAQQAEFVPVFVTVDPERDTQDVVSQYVASFSPALVGLTGTPEQVAAAEKSYHVYAKKAGNGASYSVDHTSILYLMGKNGKFVRHFDPSIGAPSLFESLNKALAP